MGWNCGGKIATKTSGDWKEREYEGWQTFVRNLIQAFESERPDGIDGAGNLSLVNMFFSERYGVFEYKSLVYFWAVERFLLF